MKEEWREVPGTSGVYLVSNLGRVMSIRIVPQPNSGPYKAVNLRYPGTRKSVHTHKLIAEAFLGACPPGHEVRHLDGDAHNNAASNLTYGTRRENIGDTKRHGRVPKGEKHWRARLTEEQVRAIKTSSISARKLARQFGVSGTTIDDVRAGRTWAHL